MNLAEGPEDLHKLFAQALNSGDLDALVALYALDGFLMARSGSVQGIGAIRQALRLAPLRPDRSCKFQVRPALELFSEVFNEPNVSHGAESVQRNVAAIGRGYGPVRVAVLEQHAGITLKVDIQQTEATRFNISR